MNGNSVLQLELDNINSWALANDMKLNPGKCKEIVVCFSRLEDLPPALIIDGKSIERVQSHKTLGNYFSIKYEVEHFHRGHDV